MIRDWMFYDVPWSKQFALFNCDELTCEPVTDADIVPVKLDNPNNPAASAAWSANAAWYFVVVDDGILLMAVGADTGVKCLKKSFKFIEAFVDAPVKMKKRKR
jgi:hypothetical protein